MATNTHGQQTDFGGKRVPKLLFQIVEEQTQTGTGAFTGEKAVRATISTLRWTGH